MLRWTVLLLFAIAASGPALGSDKPVALPVKHPARATAGPARPHYRDRTTLTYEAPLPPPPPPVIAYDPDVLFTPTVPHVPLVIRRPFLPGSSTLPGYYGSPQNFDYQGAYYGGPNIGYWDRLPYACGVYGYC
jgi:hypothetical protein